jgi:hypothetical protein
MMKLSTAELAVDRNDACRSNGGEAWVRRCRERTRRPSTVSPGCELSGREVDGEVVNGRAGR